MNETLEQNIININLNNFRNFYVVANTLNYTKAADVLHISQPAISYSINNLEKELNCNLFCKNGRKIVLTKQGEELYIYVVSAFKNLNTCLKKGDNNYVQIRYIINENNMNKILAECDIINKQYHSLDIVCGLDGFDSLDKYGCIVRVRESNGKTYIENKNRINNDSFKDARIYLKNINEGLEFLSNMNYLPYLFIDRERTDLKYGNLRIKIDDIKLLGKFVEIEYEDSNIYEVEKFLELIGIKGKPEKLYGDIFKEKIKDTLFFNKFIEELNKIIKLNYK